MKYSIIVAALFFASGPSLSDPMYEAITEHSGRETNAFNLLEHLDWKAHEANQPTDEELEAAGLTRSEIDVMRPYVPRQNIKQFIPVLKPTERSQQSLDR